MKLKTQIRNLQWGGLPLNLKKILLNIKPATGLKKYIPGYKLYDVDIDNTRTLGNNSIDMVHTDEYSTDSDIGVRGNNAMGVGTNNKIFSKNSLGVGADIETGIEGGGNNIVVGEHLRVNPGYDGGGNNIVVGNSHSLAGDSKSNVVVGQSGTIKGDRNLALSYYTSVDGYENIVLGYYSTVTGSNNLVVAPEVNIDDLSNVTAVSESTITPLNSYTTYTRYLKLTPITAPTVPEIGIIYMDEYDNKLKVWTGSAWEVLN